MLTLFAFLIPAIGLFLYCGTKPLKDDRGPGGQVTTAPSPLPREKGFCLCVPIFMLLFDVFVLGILLTGPILQECHLSYTSP